VKQYGFALKWCLSNALSPIQSVVRYTKRVGLTLWLVNVDDTFVTKHGKFQPAMISSQFVEIYASRS